MLYFWRLKKEPRGSILSDSIMVVRQILALKVRVRALVGQLKRDTRITRILGDHVIRVNF